MIQVFQLPNCVDNKTKIIIIVKLDFIFKELLKIIYELMI
jgi:hypothetical protein